jgi:putative CocE/NonD family hydrolase
MPMRDGTILRADVVRPQTTGRVPVILMMSPYPALVARMHLDHFRAVQDGFAIVAQSRRGTGASEGQFVPWRDEVSDGFDSVAWCASQPWSSGRVGTYGGSYLGQAQLYAASAAPPALNAMVTMVVPSHPHEMTYEGGALQLGSLLHWALGRAGDQIARLRAQNRSSELDADWAAWMSANDRMDELVRTTPLRDMPVITKHFPSWRDWVDRPARDGWWASFDVGPRPAVPTLMTSGWWDLFLRGTLDEWSREPRHPASRLIIGPWSHMNEGEAHGDINYGSTASAAAEDVTGQALQFLGHHLAGRPQADGPRVRLFVMGANRWRDEETWPPSGVREQRMYFHEGSVLAPSPPANGIEPMHFDFDPLAPMPTVGGRNLIPGSGGSFLTGPVEQSRLDGRRDMLRFASEPLAQDLLVVGNLSVTLHATTTAVDTDWTAKLVDVAPDGRAFNVADGIVRARFKSGGATPQLLTPGEVNRFEIDLAATATLFRAGHRLRVEVSSSNFPRFDRNPGTGTSSADTAESAFVSSRQTVFLDSERPSWITLPVLER